jgi:tetratricopeptide (TPR) repeat protein
LLWKNEHDKALPLLEEIVQRRPWDDRFLTQLAACYVQGGYLAQGERLLWAIHDNAEPDNPIGLLLLARIQLARGDLGGALKSLLTAEAMNPKFANVCVQLGDAYSRLLQWNNAKAAYERAILWMKTTRWLFKDSRPCISVVGKIRRRSMRR